MSDEYHAISKDLKIRALKHDAKYFANQSIVLYGATRSGKSTVLIDILYLLHPTVPTVFVFSPTARTNGAYKDIVADECIFDDVYLDKLESIYVRQQGASLMYHTANNLKTLGSLFVMIASNTQVGRIKSVYAKMKQKFLKIMQHPKMSDVNKKAAVKKQKKKRNEYVREYYKFIIRKNKNRLLGMELTQKQQYALTYLDFVPDVTIVFDDCGATIREWQKHPIVKKIFMQGRHDFIHIIITVQDDVGMVSDLRKNAFVSMFTSAQCASAYFSRKSNNFLPPDKKKAEKIIANLFNDRNKEKFMKLAYMRDELDQFRYFVADEHSNFRFGGDALWELHDALDNGEAVLDYDNDPLLSAFSLNI
jgi:hypothetical protein